MQKNRRNSRSKKMKISLGLLFTGCILLFISLNQQISPNIDAISRLKAEAIVNTMIHESIQATFSEISAEENLFDIEYGEDGRLQTIQANTVLLNQKLSELSICLQKRYDQLEPKQVFIPLGSIVGSFLLSQTEAGIEISVLPLSVSKCDYHTGFESQGINQTKYKFFVELVSDVRILQPFSQETLQITSNIMVSELVILGEVPENYVHVPKEDILDVT